VTVPACPRRTAHHSNPRCDSFTNVTLQYPTPCSTAHTVSESTSGLLAARSYAKMGDSAAAWGALDALFLGMSHGLIPQYRYFGTDSVDYYLPNTTIPSRRLFDPYGKSELISSSKRISSVPIHASLVLETFYLTNQTDDDLDGLERAFWHLWNYHEYLHTVVLRNCPGDACYNVIHPWETTLADDWIVGNSLKPINDQMHSTNWTLAFNIPSQVKNAWNFDNDTYLAMIYLLECQSNATRDCQSNGSIENETACETHMLQSCPFSMLDVGNAAALLQSNRDLKIMADILVDSITAPSKFQLLQLVEWEKTSKNVLDSLWHTPTRSFLSKFASEWIVQPDATNFLGLWTKMENRSWVEDVTFHLMQHNGDFAFDCGDYPLWSFGGCKADAYISPLLNYIVSRGLKRNGIDGLGHYVSNSTLNLLCQTSSGKNDEQDSACNIAFVASFDAHSSHPFKYRDVCSSTWTATAAIAYNLVIPDNAFSYTPPPPIRASWVIVLVFAELIVAFIMGMSCLVLSLSLMRRLNDVVDDNEQFNMGLLLDTASLNFFSAASSNDSSSSNTTHEMEGNELDRTLLMGYNDKNYMQVERNK